MKPLYEMPVEPPEDLAHARWRVRFFRHLVEEHRGHPYPETRDEHWASEDASYRDHLARAETALSDLEAAASIHRPLERNTLDSPSPDWAERRVM
ncbi:hypothetical protein [Roseimicrobium gellanilyticum]|uniref:hypothetical protein n=1 Tax=Roseimicrobium gellanilyticum TaxID=748857 RepID=UPI0011BFC165|nr:hypothetical protein [Roseimicrobium gellanilyticum]